jgi:hypothetical protein
MHRFWLIVAALFLVAPLCAFAAQVEEPDSMDDPDTVTPSEGMDEQPKNENVPALKETPSQKSAKEGKEIPAKPSPGAEGDFDIAVLRVLNKVTARTEKIDAPVSSVVRSGTIEIVVHSCWKSAPEDRPENAALLEISEIKQGEPPKQIFLGWMFSSSPGLSSLEHPFYDVTVVECKKDKEPGKTKEK